MTLIHSMRSLSLSLSKFTVLCKLVLPCFALDPSVRKMPRMVRTTGCTLRGQCNVYPIHSQLRLFLWRSLFFFKVLLWNLLDSAGGGLAFWSVGYAFAYGGDSKATGDKTFIGTQGFFMQNDTIRFENWFFQFAFACAVSCTFRRNNRCAFYV